MNKWGSLSGGQESEVSRDPRGHRTVCLFSKVNEKLLWGFKGRDYEILTYVYKDPLRHSAVSKDLVAVFGEQMGGGSRAEAKAIILREARVQWELGMDSGYDV